MKENGIKVLIVDDNAIIRSLLNNTLRNNGYSVVGQLASGSGLMDAIVKTRPDIVCLDYQLPDSNGLTLLREVRTSYPDVSVIMITGETDIALENAAADAGAAGFITKPFSLDALAQELQQVVQMRKAVNIINLTPSAAEAATEFRATAVIADDSATMRNLLSSILTNAKIDVVATAANGREALLMVAEHKPKLVFLDCDMPLMSGLDALRSITEQWPDIKVVMITGRSDRETILQANQLQAKGYVLKPFQPQKVVDVIDKLLQGAPK